MDIFLELENAEVRWYDESQTIAYCHVFKKWDWNDATQLIQALYDIVIESPNDVYSIIHLDGSGDMIPSAYAILNLRKLLSQPDPPNEQMTLFVTQSSIMKTFIDIVEKISNVKDKVETYKYFSSLEDTLHYIAKVKMGDPVIET